MRLKFCGYSDNHFCCLNIEDDIISEIRITNSAENGGAFKLWSKDSQNGCTVVGHYHTPYGWKYSLADLIDWETDSLVDFDFTFAVEVIYHAECNRHVPLPIFIVDCPDDTEIICNFETCH